MFEKLVIESKPVRCNKCKSRIYTLETGKYYCKTCGNELYDDYGKVKKYIKENVDASILYISQATGVEIELVKMICMGEDMKPSLGSPYYLKCERCGCSIKEGKYCEFCVSELAGGIKQLIKEDIRKMSINPEMKGKMHIRR